MIYERLADIFDEVEESYEGARAVLEALRDADSEVLTAGIDPDSWRAVFDALLGAADTADAARADEALAEQKARWSTIRQELERLGCRIWQLTTNENLWRVEAPGIALEVDLASAEVEGLWIGPIDDPISALPHLVRSKLQDRNARLADKARRDGMRENHTWCPDRRVWLPKDGKGPPIKGGGSAP